MSDLSMFTPKTKRGEARMEYYTPTKQEPFGLAKRTRRLKRGILTTKPDGTYDQQWVKAFGKGAGN